jgi:uncharacterized protein
MQNAKKVPRGLQTRISRSWASSAVVVLEGARATGKTTLARGMVDTDRFVSFVEHPDQLVRAKADLQGFVESLPYGCVLDEAQLVPNLQLAIKAIVDRTGRPGQFLLTGSARLSQTELGGSAALAGRVSRIPVRGFTQSELTGAPADVITALFESDPREWAVQSTTQESVVSRFAGGGMPTLHQIADFAERARRTSDYVDDLFSGDVYETGRNRSGIARLFRYLAATSGGIENFAKYQDGTQLSKDAVVGYLDALRAVYLVDDIPAYSRVPGTRETDRPRSVVLDPTFVVAQVGGESAATLLDVERAGAFLETCVAQELFRLLSWSSTNAKLHHWRRNDRDEVDLVLERNDGMLVAIEVKSKRSVTNRDGVGIEAFRSQYPDRFLRGFVIHPGDVVLPIGRNARENIWALPISALWMIGESVSGPIEDPLSFQERLDRAVGTLRGEILKIARDEVLTRQNRLVAAEPLVLERMNLLVEALKQFDVEAEISAPGQWIAAWSRPSAEQNDLLFDGAVSILFGRENVDFARVSVNLVGETVKWELSGGGALTEGALGDLIAAEVSSRWDADHSGSIDFLFGLLADALPEIVQRCRGDKRQR